MRVVDVLDRVRDERLDARRDFSVSHNLRLDIVLETIESSRRVRRKRAQSVRKLIGVSNIPQTNPVARRFGGVRGTDAALRRTDFIPTQLRLAQAIDFFMKIEQQMRAIRHHHTPSSVHTSL